MVCRLEVVGEEGLALKELVQLLYDKVGQVIGGVDEVLFLLYGYGYGKVCCLAMEVVLLSSPDSLREPFLFLINDFLIVILKENGDSTIVKFKLLFLM